jgi:ABC-type nitrate/sulfonate/bicarbonate transport system permease component
MIRSWLPSVVLLLLLLGAWQLYCAVSGIDPLLLPPPTAVASALVGDAGLLWSNFLVTAQEVLLGVAIATAAAVALASGIHASDTLRRACYPLLVASQTVPVPIIAPILLVWLGFSLAPKLVIVALVCFFPITVAALDGLAAADPQLRKLMASLGASRWQTFARVEAPGALPALFSGLRIAVAVSLVGAVFAEWSGADSGLGYVILQARPQLLTARACAAVVVLAAFAVVLFVSVGALERRLVPWGRR